MSKFRIFTTKSFSRWFRKSGLNTESLLQAVMEMQAGLVDAQLGHGLVKKRVASPGLGKRSAASSMKSNQKSSSRIIQEMQASMNGLDRALKVSKKTMRFYQAFDDLGVASMSAHQIKELREKACISQAVLAAVLNTSLSTVQKWEIGDKKPSGPSLKLLSLIDRKGLQAVM